MDTINNNIVAAKSTGSTTKRRLMNLFYIKRHAYMYTPFQYSQKNMRGCD